MNLDVSIPFRILNALLRENFVPFVVTERHMKLNL
jgi:hypothetical protein